MTELLAKLINFGYELFGVILPGIIVILFFLLWWTALGPLASVWTGGAIPEFNAETAGSIIDSLNVATGIGVAVPLFAGCYFAGHLLLWIARSGKENQKAADTWYKRLGYSLVFSIPKPAAPFNPKLQKLFEIVQKRFSADQAPLEWREFYPVAKSFLAQRVANSLVATYQNKYTLHRSITTAGALLFWVSLITIVVARFTGGEQEHLPSYLLLSVLLIGGLVLVWGFSASYIYHWEMFGNSIVTETYCKLYEPQNDQSKR